MSDSVGRPRRALALSISFAVRHRASGGLCVPGSPSRRAAPPEPPSPSPASRPSRWRPRAGLLEHKASVDPSPSCTAFALCCAGLSGPEGASCESAVSGASEPACMAALSTLVKGGGCGQPSDAGAPVPTVDTAVPCPETGACQPGTSKDAGGLRDASGPGVDATAPGIDCQPAGTCSSGEPLQVCIMTGASGACTSAVIMVQGGGVFACASCSDCAAATASAEAQCSASPPPAVDAGVDAEARLRHTSRASPRDRGRRLLPLHADRPRPLRGGPRVLRDAEHGRQRLEPPAGGRGVRGRRIALVGVRRSARLRGERRGRGLLRGGDGRPRIRRATTSAGPPSPGRIAARAARRGRCRSATRRSIRARAGRRARRSRWRGSCWGRACEGRRACRRTGRGIVTLVTASFTLGIRFAPRVTARGPVGKGWGKSLSRSSRRSSRTAGSRERRPSGDVPHPFSAALRPFLRADPPCIAPAPARR